MIADSGNRDIGRPALTTSLRGTVSLPAEVRTLRAAVHSGVFGGAVPDGLTVKCQGVRLDYGPCWRDSMTCPGPS